MALKALNCTAMMEIYELRRNFTMQTCWSFTLNDLKILMALKALNRTIMNECQSRERLPEADLVIGIPSLQYSSMLSKPLILLDHSI